MSNRFLDLEPVLADHAATFGLHAVMVDSLGDPPVRARSLWILLAMAAGLLLGRALPGMAEALDAVTLGDVSLPIAIGLLVMMYPVLAKVRYDETDKVTRDGRLMVWTANE